MAKKNLTNNQILMKELIKGEYEDNGTYLSVDDYFEFFAAQQCLKSFGLSDDEIESCITGGGNDGGCDSIGIFLNGDILTADQIENVTAPKSSLLELWIIQSKNETSFKEDVLMKWKTVSDNLLNMSNEDKDFTSRYSAIVIERFKDFRDTVKNLIRSQIKISIHYAYVSLAVDLHPNIQQQADELCVKVKEIYPASDVYVKFIGANELMELYNKVDDVSVELELADAPISLMGNSDYVALVNLDKYYSFITDENGKLQKGYFEANVRDYQGKNSVNTCIAETLNNNNGEDFWWLNNGVTILAEKITPVTAKTLLIANPEIVNGLQTSREIYNFILENPEAGASEKRNVLVRIIKPVSEESRDNIIFATNNQTNIPKSSLRVTDNIHLHIEMYFKSRGLYYDRRKNYYKNQKKKASDIVGVSFLAQCLISIILRKPDYARARPSTLLTDDDTYNTLYDEKNSLDAYFKTAQIGIRIRNNLKKTSTMTTAERSDVQFYLLYAVVVDALGKKKVKFSDMAQLDVESISEDQINSLKESVYKKYKELGGNGRVAKSDSFIKKIDELIDSQE